MEGGEGTSGEKGVRVYQAEEDEGSGVGFYQAEVEGGGGAVGGYQAEEKGG